MDWFGTVLKILLVVGAILYVIAVIRLIDE